LCSDIKDLTVPCLKKSSAGHLFPFGQAVWVWSVSLPVTVVNATDRNPSIEARDIIGWIIWLVGICVEATADQQKLVFKNSPSNRGKWCDVGLWKYSRHPNYFGEVS
jgi:steroid 5-alpha reductase family enzyme